jgi:hypothetical protein
MKKLLILKEPQYDSMEHMEWIVKWFNQIQEICKDTDTTPIMIPSGIDIIKNIEDCE